MALERLNRAARQSSSITMSSSEQSLFETYEKAYCNISTEVSKALNSLEKAPIGTNGYKIPALVLESIVCVVTSNLPWNSCGGDL